MAAAKSKASGSKHSHAKSRPASTSQLSAPAPEPDRIEEIEEAASSLKKAKLSKGINGSTSTTQRYSEAGNTNAQRSHLNATAAGANGLLTSPDDIGRLTDDQANLDTNIDDLNEPTLGERLKGMKVGSRMNGTARASDEEDEDEQDEDRIALPQGSLSLGQTLTQALHSNDSALLSSCLAHSDPTVIRSSVSKLSGPLAVKLLEHCVDRMGRGGKRSSGALGSARTRGIIEWIRATLIIHTGYLMSIPNLVHRLSALHATLSGRLAAHERLLALNGRLELVLGQIEMRAAYTAEQARKIQGVRAKAKSNGNVDIQEQKKGQMEGKVWVEERSDEDVSLAQNGMQLDEEEDEQSSDELDDVVRGEEEGIVQDIALGNDTLGNTSIDSDEEGAEAESGEDVEMSGNEEDDEGSEEGSEEEEEEGEEDESALDEEGDSDEVDEEGEEDSEEDTRGGLLDLEAESTDGDEEDGSEESD